jgi:hypothetical protein
MSAHLKSRLDPDNVDPNGYSRREAELKTVVKIYNEILAHHPGLPIIVMGDFNGNASEFETEPEFLSLYKDTELRDVGALAQLGMGDRSTYYQVQRNALTESKQIDYAFLSPAAQSLLDLNSVNFYRYRDEFGLRSSPPTTIDAKLSLPSDHDPIFFAMNLELN